MSLKTLVTLEANTSQLQQKMLQKRKFLGHVSHMANKKKNLFIIYGKGFFKTKPMEMLQSYECRFLKVCVSSYVASKL